MKRLFIFTGDVFLIFGAVGGAMGALITAFDLPVDVRTLALVWFGAAVLFSLAANLANGKGILILTPLVLLPILITLPEIIEGTKSVLFAVTAEFSKWISIPLLFPGSRPIEDVTTLFFVAIGLIVILLLSVTICLRRSTLLTMLFTLPFALATFVLVTTLPDIRFIIVLLAVYITILISGALYPHDREKKGLAVFPALGLTLLLLGVGGIVAPEDSRTESDFTRSIDSEIRFFLSNMGLIAFDNGVGWPPAEYGLWQFNTDHVMITYAGSRFITDESLVEVEVSEPGVFYLRGFSMEGFDGRYWYRKPSADSAPDEVLSRYVPAIISAHHEAYIADGGTKLAQMTITQTGDVTQDVYYTPYYASALLTQNEYNNNPYYFTPNGYPFAIEFLFNSGKSMREIYLDFGMSNTEDALFWYTDWIYSSGVYTQVDRSTAEELRRIAFSAGIDENADRDTVAEQVAAVVIASARYTLAPAVTPEDADFALHFLTASREGYCIHFATAATLMLRALDIPARFTSGFLVNVPQSEVGLPITLTDRNAHAWVEVYYDHMGWIPLEVTPSEAFSGDYAGGSNISPYPRDPSEPPDYTLPAQSSPTPSQPGQGTQPSPEDSAEAARAEADEQAFTRGWRVFFLVVSGAVVCTALVLLRLLLAKILIRKRFSQDDTNKAVICVWRYMIRLDRRRKKTSDVEDLVLKARFSHHIISETERSKMIKCFSMLRDKVYQDKGIFGRFILRVVLGT